MNTIRLVAVWGLVTAAAGIMTLFGTGPGNKALADWGGLPWCFCRSSNINPIHSAQETVSISLGLVPMYLVFPQMGIVGYYANPGSLFQGTASGGDDYDLLLNGALPPLVQPPPPMPPIQTCANTQCANDYTCPLGDPVKQCWQVVTNIGVPFTWQSSGYVIDFEPIGEEEDFQIKTCFFEASHTGDFADLGAITASRNEATTASDIAGSCRTKEWTIYRQAPLNRPLTVAVHESVTTIGQSKITEVLKNVSEALLQYDGYTGGPTTIRERLSDQTDVSCNVELTRSNSWTFTNRDVNICSINVSDLNDDAPFALIIAPWDRNSKKADIIIVNSITFWPERSSQHQEPYAFHLNGHIYIPAALFVENIVLHEFMHMRSSGNQDLYVCSFCNKGPYLPNKCTCPVPDFGNSGTVNVMDKNYLTTKVSVTSTQCGSLY